MDDSELLARIDERVLGIHESLKRFTLKQESQEMRIGKIETKQSWIIGVGTFLVSVVGFIARAVFK